jgi:hypothetical protein
MRHDVVGNAEACGELPAVSVVPVEELDHARWLAGRAHALFHNRSVDRVDEPHAPEVNEGVAAPLEELVADPAERELELVAGSQAVRTSRCPSRPRSTQRAVGLTIFMAYTR